MPIFANLFGVAQFRIFFFKYFIVISKQHNILWNLFFFYRFYRQLSFAFLTRITESAPVKKKIMCIIYQHEIEMFCENSTANAQNIR